MKIEFKNEDELIYFNNLLTDAQIFLNAENEIEFGDKLIVDFGDDITEPYIDENFIDNECSNDCDECYEALMRELDEKQEVINILVEALCNKLRNDIMC